MAGLKARLLDRDRTRLFAMLFASLAVVTVAALVSAFLRVRALHNEVDASGATKVRVSDLESQITILRSEKSKLADTVTAQQKQLDGVSFSQEAVGANLEGDYNLKLQPATCFNLVCDGEETITIDLTIKACGTDYCLTGDGWVGDYLKNQKGKAVGGGLQVKGQSDYTCQGSEEKDSRYVLAVWPTGATYDSSAAAWTVTTLGATVSVSFPESSKCNGGGKSFTGGTT